MTKLGCSLVACIGRLLVCVTIVLKVGSRWLSYNITSVVSLMDRLLVLLVLFLSYYFHYYYFKYRGEWGVQKGKTED